MKYKREGGKGQKGKKGKEKRVEKEDMRNKVSK